MLSIISGRILTLTSKYIYIKMISFQENLFQKPPNVKVLPKFELGLPDSDSEVLTISWF